MKLPVLAAGILIVLLLAAGCTGTRQGPANPGPAGTALPAAASPAATAAPVIPDVTAALPLTTTGTGIPLLPAVTADRNLSSYILMDSTDLVVGEVGSFHIYNHGPGTLKCHTKDPSYTVFARRANGTWNSEPVIAVTSIRAGPLVLDAGDSTGQYRFVTDGWNAGEYQLVANCEADGRAVFHPFTVKQKPAVMVF